MFPIVGGAILNPRSLEQYFLTTLKFSVVAKVEEIDLSSTSVTQVV